MGVCFMLSHPPTMQLAWRSCERSCEPLCSTTHQHDQPPSLPLPSTLSPLSPHLTSPPSLPPSFTSPRPVPPCCPLLPPDDLQEKLVKIAKKLKKNNVAVDIVSFGCEQDNSEKLEAFHTAVNSNDNSHLVVVPPGPVLSDVLIGSPIFQGEGGGAYGFGGGAGTTGATEGFEFGVDPNLDPELALALRVSLEEERARQNMVAAASGPPKADAGASGAAGEAAGSEGQKAGEALAGGAAGGAADMDMDEDALLQQALAMSMQVGQEPGEEAGAPAASAAAPPVDASMFDAVEDEELKLALQMSMQDAGPDTVRGGVHHGASREINDGVQGLGTLLKKRWGGRVWVRKKRCVRAC